MKHPTRIRLWVEARKARKQGQWDLASELEQELQREKLGQQERSDISWNDIERRIDSLITRMDGKRRKRRKKAKCNVGYSCGKACIPKSKSCIASGSPAAEKLQQLVQVSSNGAATTGRAESQKSGTAASNKQKTPAGQEESTSGSKPAKASTEGTGEIKPPTKSQLAKQEAKVKELQRKARGQGGAKYVYLRDREAAKLADMKEHAADPRGWSKAQAEKAAARTAQDAKEKKWKALQDKLDARQLESGLTDSDKAAIRDYTEPRGAFFKRSYSRANECVRNPPCKDKEVNQFVKEIDQALNKIPANVEGDAFYRGIAVTDGTTNRLFDSLASAKPGTVLTDPGFGSYSSSEKIADSFMNDEINGEEVWSRIKIINRSSELKPISKFAQFEREYEALLPRGVQCTVRRVTKSDDGLTLVVELE
jgi:hypothetical protein